MLSFNVPDAFGVVTLSWPLFMPVVLNATPDNLLFSVSASYLAEVDGDDVLPLSVDVSPLSGDVSPLSIDVLPLSGDVLVDEPLPRHPASDNPAIVRIHTFAMLIVISPY